MGLGGRVGRPLLLRHPAMAGHLHETTKLDLFSAAPTSGPWTVSAVDTATFFGQTASLQFSFDKSSGQSGDHIAMTIHALSGQPGTTRIFEIRSTLGSETQSWYGVVEN